MELLNQMDGFDSLGQVRFSFSSIDNATKDVMCGNLGKNDHGNESTRYTRSCSASSRPS